MREHIFKREKTYNLWKARKKSVNNGTREKLKKNEKCIRNWPPSIGAFQDHCKQIMINMKYSSKPNLVKNPNWREADQLAI